MPRPPRRTRGAGKSPATINISVRQVRARRYDIIGPDGELLMSCDTRVATEVAIDQLRDQVVAGGDELRVEWD